MVDIFHHHLLPILLHQSEALLAQNRVSGRLLSTIHNFMRFFSLY